MPSRVTWLSRPPEATKRQAHHWRRLRPRSLWLALALAGLLVAGACTASGDAQEAEQALRRYFATLHEGRYGDAAELYGGNYDQLAEWNPDLDPADQAALLERGCTVNGLHCLPIRTIGSREDSAPGRFEFTVRHEAPGGGVFELASADAAAAGNPSQMDFTYTVVRRGDRFLVLELPPYAD